MSAFDGRLPRQSRGLIVLLTQVAFALVAAMPVFLLEF